MLYELVRCHLETMLQEGCERTEHGFGYPRYVERTFRRYLACGLPSEGLARIKCDACGDEHLVAFSCKQRAVCPSCQARRMADLAAQLCDGLLPQVPYRQYVFTFPVPQRLAMIRDSAVLSALLQRTIGALFAQLRRRARTVGVDCPQPAALTSIQRFGGSLNINVHFHVIVPDGVFSLDAQQQLEFIALPPPSDEDIDKLVHSVSRRVDRWLAANLTDDNQDDDQQWRDHAINEAQPPRRPRWLVDIEQPVVAPKPRCADFDGYAVHAQTAVAAHDRTGLERLLRYCLRGPLATERLSLLDAGRQVRYRFARPWSNGRSYLDLEPVAFLRRIALLIPPPRTKLLRYHGLFAPRSKHRNNLAALLPSTDAPTVPPDTPQASPDPVPIQLPQQQLPPLELPPRRNLRWAELLRRVFAIDILTCGSCGGAMRLIAQIKDPAVLAKVCAHMGWPTSAPPCEPARLPAQMDFDHVDLPPHHDRHDHVPGSARAPPRPHRL